MGTAMLRNKYLCSPLPLSAGQTIFGGFFLGKQCPERVPALQPRGVMAVVQPSLAPQHCPQTSGGMEDSSQVLTDASHFSVRRHITITYTERVFLSRAGCWEKPDSSSQLSLYKQQENMNVHVGLQAPTCEKLSLIPAQHAAASPLTVSCTHNIPSKCSLLLLSDTSMAAQVIFPVFCNSNAFIRLQE